MAKTLRDRYGSAKEIAGSTANNKASLANKAAKQAAAMSNNSKMTQALLGAQAANDAVSSGFDEGLDKGANMAAQVASEEARAKEREQNQKQFEATQKFQAEQAEKRGYYIETTKTLKKISKQISYDDSLMKIIKGDNIKSIDNIVNAQFKSDGANRTKRKSRTK